MNDTRRWKAPFAIVWTGQAFSLVGSALVRFALIWWLTERTGSATTLAVAALSSRLPAIVLGPLVGALIDRWDRRWVMAIADTLIALFTALLAYLYWLGVVQIWHVYVILFLRALGDTFQSPAMRASTPLMVPEEHLTRLAGINQTLQGVVRIASPLLGALLLALWPIQSLLWLDLITAALAVGPLLFIQIPQPEPALQDPEKRGPGLLREVSEGFGYVWRWRGLFLLVSTSALIMLFVGPASALIPLLITGHFGGGALQLGWLNSAHGFGIVAGGMVLSLWGGFKRRIVTSIVGTFGVGLGLLAVGCAPATAFWLALAGMLLAGLMVPVYSGPRLAIYQACVPPEMQGRFFTLNDSLLQVMMPLGLSISGPMSDTVGVCTWIVLAGVACLVVALARVLTPSILHIEGRSD